MNCPDRPSPSENILPLGSICYSDTGTPKVNNPILLPDTAIFRLDETRNASVPVPLLPESTAVAENSITHGFQRKRKPCILFIQGQVNEESGILLLKIADNGIGIPLEKIQEIEQRYFQEEEALHNDHIGLDNVLRRLHLFYGKDFRFSLRSQENHYTVITLYIPNFPSEPSR